MSFKLMDAFVRLRVDSGPMTSALTRVQSDMRKFSANGIRVKFDLTAFRQMGRAIDSATGRLGTAVKGAERLGNALDGTANRAVRMTTAIASATAKVARLTAVAAVGTAAGAASTIKAAGDQEVAVSNLGRVSGVTGDALDRMNQQLLAFASTTGGVSLKEVNSLAEFGARLGIGDGLDEASKSKAIVDFVKDLTRVKTALDDIPVDESATKIVRILNVFGEGPGKIGNFASALVKLDNASTASARDILEITKRLSGMLAALKIGPTAAMALAATMRDLGIDVEVGATAIQGLLIKMSANTQLFAKQLGFAKGELEGLLDTSPMEAMRAVLERLSRYSPREQAEQFSKLGLAGQRTASTIWQLAGGFEKFDGFLKVANEEWESQAAIQEAVEARSKTLWTSLQRLWNRLQVLSVEIGTHLLPAFKELSGLLGDLATRLTAVVKGAGGEFDGWVGAVTNHLRNLRVLLSDLPFAAQFMGAMIAEKMSQLSEVFGWLANNIVKAFTFVRDSVLAVMTNLFNWIATKVVPIAVSLGQAIGNAIKDGIQSIFAKEDPDIVKLRGQNRQSDQDAALAIAVGSKTRGQANSEKAARDQNLAGLIQQRKVATATKDTGLQRNLAAAFNAGELGKLFSGMPSMPKFDALRMTPTAKGNEARAKLAERRKAFDSDQAKAPDRQAEPVDPLDRAAEAFRRLGKLGTGRGIAASGAFAGIGVLDRRIGPRAMGPGGEADPAMERNDFIGGRAGARIRERRAAMGEVAGAEAGGMLPLVGLGAIGGAVARLGAVANRAKGKGGGPTAALPRMPDEGYRPQFLDPLEFNRKIQDDLFNVKKNDPMLALAQASSEALKVQGQAITENLPKQTSSLAFLEQAVKDGSLVGPAMAT